MRMRFQYKLLLSLVAILLLTALTISGIWYTHSRNMATDTMLQLAELLVNERIREVDRLIADIDYQSRVISHNNAIVDRGLGNKWNYSYLNSQAVKKLNNYIDSIYASSPSLTGLEIANDQGDYYGRGIQRGWSYIQSQGIDTLLQEHPDDLLILPYYYGDDSEIREIMFISNIHYYGKITGYSMISIDYAMFAQAFEDISPADTVITVRNAMGDLLYTSPNYASGPGETVFKSISDSGSGKQLVKDDQGREWLVLGRETAGKQLSVNVAVPMAGIIADIRRQFGDIAYIILAMIALLLLIVLAVSDHIGRNISTLMGAIRRFSEGDMDHAMVVHGDDEFSQVAASFNDMKQNIKQLMEANQAKEREKMELQIRVLQSQINLHFLFNTLNTIKNLAYIQRVPNIERLVGALMELLHLSMADGKDFVTLEAEMNYVKHYLEIYKYKSVKQIDCVIEMDENVKDAIIPKFMLQPLVENAIIHGIEPSEDQEDGLIRIQAVQDAGDLKITITDNGKGFDTEAVSSFNGIGIANTDQRIKAHYGEQYGLQIESVPGESTTVHITVPCRKEMPPW